MENLISGRGLTLQENQEIRNPIISVIIPVYNVAPYLREALDSVVNQTYKNLEIIVIDDGSTDGSDSICDEYASRDLRFIVIHQLHHNQSVARNIALDLVTGEYLSFLDSDDAFHPSFMQIMLDTILRVKSDIVICKYKNYHTAKKMKQTKRGKVLPLIVPGSYNRDQTLDGRINGKINIEIWNKLYKRELWDGVRFPLDLYASADTIVSFQVAFNCNSVYVTDTPLYLYRKRPGSLTALYSNKIITSRIRGISYVSDFLRSHSPEVFSEQQIRRYNISSINTLMGLYVGCSEEDASDYLKRQIIDLVEETGIENCGYNTRAAYFMTCHCPWLLKCVYPVYNFLRRR